MKGVYEHYKGEMYIVIGEGVILTEDNKLEVLMNEDKNYKEGRQGKHTETEEQVKYFKDKKGIFYIVSEDKRYEEEKVVIYFDMNKEMWVRPYEMFFEQVEKQGEKRPRFRYLG